VVPALQPFVAVASVLLRFVLLFPRIRRLNVSAVTADLAGHNPADILHCCPPPAPLTTAYRTAMRRKRNLFRV
jgi:hypothetical protein